MSSLEKMPGYTTMDWSQGSGLWSGNSSIHQQRRNSELRHTLKKSYVPHLEKRGVVIVDFLGWGHTISSAGCVKKLKT
jgi:hypothetical protein